MINFSVIPDKELKAMQMTLQRIERALQIEKPQTNEYYDSSEVMILMNWSQSTFYRWIKTVQHTKVRGRIMVHKSVLDSLVNSEGNKKTSLEATSEVSSTNVKP